ncbi:MAG: DUF2225 domain-containing protein [Leptospiraceae bacterium]|nr:DUF2225 domain-containing protein [Leptospiraceae bacterium]MCP5497224.1 DUF2225 domain-containing protein [Leptospiraceae bacterium]
MSQTVQPNKKVSFRSKDVTICPICDEEHQREQMFAGGGRLIAGKLTIELRRLYEKNKKFGRIHPNDYIISVCPGCLYACFPKDWNVLPGPDLEKIKSQSNDRKVNIEKILGPLDFNEDRNIVLGAASYLLAVDCYQNRSPSIAPTPKKAVCAMRSAWYFEDLHQEFPDFNFEKVRDLLYLKAASWYGSSLEIMQNGAEPIDMATGILGPDSDKNWGFDGVKYLNAYLASRYKDKLVEDKGKQLKMLTSAKRMLARLYGSGKSKKDKPSVLIEMTRDLYDQLAAQIEELGGDK